MRSLVVTVSLCCIAGVAMACATTRAPTADTSAQLIGCDTAAPTPGAFQGRGGVLLRFTVDERGRPLVGTARFTPASTSDTPKDSEIAEARQILASCTFRPALHDDKPVSSQRSMVVPLNSRLTIRRSE
jgi:hypothetical protein